MRTYPYVEDYLEVIAGKRDPISNLIKPNAMWSSPTPIINLARYDVGFVNSVTDTTVMNNSLTDKQAELALKLIGKYQRQLQSHQIDVEGIVQTPQYRNPLRIIDRSKEVRQAGDHLAMKFPYDAKMIETIRDMGKQSQGSVIFDREAKVWKIALTEYNVSWVTSFAQSHQFTIAPEVDTHMQRIIECEQSGFDICLTVTADGYTITNAADSLVEYVNECGGFTHDNLVKLADLSAVLGYCVEEPIRQYIEETHGASNSLLMFNREYEFNESPDTVSRVVEYAKLTNRWPLVVYNPTPDNTFNHWAEYFEPEQVCAIGNKRTEDIHPDHKLIYTHKPLRSLERIPLLVSHVGMAVGQDKAFMISRADKIFYSGVKLGGKQQ